MDVRPGHLGGHSTGPLRPIHLPGRTSYHQLRTSPAKWYRISTYWKPNRRRPVSDVSFTYVSNTSFNTWRCRSDFTSPSMNTCTSTVFLCIAHNTWVNPVTNINFNTRISQHAARGAAAVCVSMQVETKLNTKHDTDRSDSLWLKPFAKSNLSIFVTSRRFLSKIVSCTDKICGVTLFALLQGRDTQYLLYRRLSGPQSQSGRVWKISPPTGYRPPHRPPSSESQYRLSYPGPHLIARGLKIVPTVWTSDSMKIPVGTLIHHYTLVFIVESLEIKCYYRRISILTNARICCVELPNFHHVSRPHAKLGLNNTTQTMEGFVLNCSVIT